MIHKHTVSHNLTDTQRSLLRNALGLSLYTKEPTGNWLSQHYAQQHPADVDKLVSLGYLHRGTTHGPAGAEEIITITDAGRALVYPE